MRNDTKSTQRRGTRSHVFATLSFCVLLCAGCGEDSGTTAPIAGGGEEFVLDAALYASVVAPIIIAKGCDAEGDCHGGGIRGSFQLSPRNSKDSDFDFVQVALQVNGYDPANSPILTEPLAAGNGATAHAFEPFADDSDPDYVSILNWILSGEFQ